MAKLLLEDFCGEFIVDRSKPPIKEDLQSGRSLTRLPGRFSMIGVVNGNRREYPSNVWEKNLREGSVLREKIGKCSTFGLLEHPSDGKIDLRSPIAVLTTKIEMKGAEILGEMTIINTPEGQKLLALIEAGWNPTVSSRGYGSLVARQDGVDVVQEDYVCEGWDVVLTPSFSEAVLNPDRSSTEPKLAAQMATAESQPPAQATVKESQDLPPVAAVPAAESKTAPAAAQPPATPAKSKPKVMEIKTLKESIAALRAVDVSAATPVQFAEGLTKLTALHDEVSKFVAEDPTRMYEGQRLHTEVEGLEKAWSDSLNNLRGQLKKVTEDNTKLLKVLKAVAETALGYKTKLGAKTKLNEQLLKRGRGWKTHAESIQTQLSTITQRAELAYESLDEFKRVYDQSVVALGKQVLALEFKEKVNEPKIQEALKAVNHPKRLVKIREQLEGKKPAAAKPVTESKKPAAAAPKAAAAAPAPKAAPAAAPVVEAVVTNNVTDPRSVTESVSIARRLSALK